MIPNVTAPPLFSGAFEAHVTVRATQPQPLSPSLSPEAEALERYAAAHGMAFVDIVLDRGRTPHQPMLTLRESGALPAVREAVEAAGRRLRAAGFDVARTKIEASPWADGVPDTDEAATALGARYYFEHHVKLLLTPGADTSAPARLAGAHTAHLSRNARRLRADGRAERFVTQRCRLVGRRTAGARLDALVAELRRSGHEVASVEREFVVHDSDESLDEGWITEERTDG
ncbi:hypothetical protein [Streptomyces syringium]|uniref:hypothetical protein n=1 Tax=Streptomyces syringium TaxID=76729 RepID=UPI0033DCCCFD